MSISESYERTDLNLHEIDSTVDQLDQRADSTQILYNKNKEEEKAPRSAKNAEPNQNLL